MIPVRAILAGLAAAAVLGLGAWLVHVGGEGARGDAAEARAEELHRAEEARRAADLDAGRGGAASERLLREWSRGE